MTTVATVCGHFPLTLVTGPGAIARNSIGVVLVGGMSIGTLFTLFIVPSVYILLAKDHSKERALTQATEPATPSAEFETVETTPLELPRPRAAG
jgi:multidrug efflux pump